MREYESLYDRRARLRRARRFRRRLVLARWPRLCWRKVFLLAPRCKAGRSTVRSRETARAVYLHWSPWSPLRRV